MGNPRDKEDPTQRKKPGVQLALQLRVATAPEIDGPASYKDGPQDEEANLKR
jgi:hypothetical protein